jgi:hypothetical protein
LVHKKKGWRTNAIFLIVLWLILLIASVTILSSVVTPFLKTLQTQNLVSFDWSGYGVSSNVLFPQPLIVGINGSWIVPAVAVSNFDTFSAAWIGIGGQSENTLIQIGSEHDSLGGKAEYALWYEMLPADSITIPNIDVSPGDKITAAITLINSNSNEWLMEINDLTAGKGFSQVFRYNSSRLTAEWIIEKPTVNNKLATLANFGTITFTEINAHLGTSTGNLSSFPNYKILMEDRMNNELVIISDFSKDGSSFTINYG